MVQPKLDTRAVTVVRVVVHTIGAWPNGMSDNHWSIYLLMADGQSVRMNMRAELGDPKGTLEWQSLAYTLTTSAIKHWDFPTKPDVTVKEMYDLVMRKGRDQYNMSGGGSGCRWWIYVIINDFEQDMLASKTAASDLYPDLLFQYSTNAGKEKQLDMVKGEFTA